MTGRLDWRSLLAIVPSLPSGPSALAGATIVAVTVATFVAFLTIDPPPAPVRRAKTSTVAPSAAPTPAAAAQIALPPNEPPPEPTSADIASAAPPSTAPASTPASSTAPADWAARPIEDLRSRADLNEIAAMEELARRLVQGIGVTKDAQAGAGWLMRAAELGSAQSAFNVGVMYERGFVVERDSTRAVEWYRKAANANLAVAKHNLALLLRDGKGAPRNGKEAIELLRSAARQGMAASMYSLGDIFERGDAAPKDAAAALAWFAIAAEFERQLDRGEETALSKTALQHAQALERVLTPAELERAQQLGQSEFRQIVEALTPPKPGAAEPPAAAPGASAPPSADTDLPDWPKATVDQVRAIQQFLVDLKLLRDKPDGVLGPMTRAAIRDFQRTTGLREAGEPTKEVYAALKQVLARRDVVTDSPLPMPPKAAATPPSPPASPAAPAPAPAAIDLGGPQTAPPPPSSADIALTTPKPKPAEVAEATPALIPAVPLADPPKPEPPKIDPTKPPMLQIPANVDRPKIEPPPARINLGPAQALAPPPTSADFARSIPKTDSAEAAPQAVPDAWPTSRVDQVKAIQRLLHDLKLYRDDPHGQLSPATRVAIRDYERIAGLKLTGEPSKALFESLKEMRGLMVAKPNAGSN